MASDVPSDQQSGQAGPDEFGARRSKSEWLPPHRCLPTLRQIACCQLARPPELNSTTRLMYHLRVALGTAAFMWRPITSTLARLPAYAAPFSTSETRLKWNTFFCSTFLLVQRGACCTPAAALSTCYFPQVAWSDSRTAGLFTSLGGWLVQSLAPVLLPHLRVISADSSLLNPPESKSFCRSGGRPSQYCKVKCCAPAHICRCLH
jgi:hypothetical protein